MSRFVVFFSFSCRWLVETSQQKWNRARSADSDGSFKHKQYLYRWEVALLVTRLYGKNDSPVVKINFKEPGFKLTRLQLVPCFVLQDV